MLGAAIVLLVFVALMIPIVAILVDSPLGRSIARRLEGNGSASGELGELHRKVIALRGSLSHGDPASILPECERGEHFAIARFERALAMKMPLQVADTLLDLVTSCRERHAAFDRMRHPW